jgi:aspartate kinase
VPALTAASARESRGDESRGAGPAGVARTPAVIKIGGSVLTGPDAFHRAADFLARRQGPSVVVVSAQLGQTDALLAEARTFRQPPDGPVLDLLWSTGELRSVALLSLACQSRGLSAAALDVHAAGLRQRGQTVDLNPIAIRAALAAHDVVVLPGFLATRGQQVVTLGRGGSDWSAVMLAAALGAPTCVLVKDVDGYYDRDPVLDPRAVRIDRLTYGSALAMADAGCPVVQRQALVAAQAAGLTLAVRSFTGTGTEIAAVPSVPHQSSPVTRT